MADITDLRDQITELIDALRSEGLDAAAENLVRIRDDVRSTAEELGDAIGEATERLREMSDASRTLERGTERLIRTLTGVTDTADGVVGGLGRMMAEADSFRGALGKLTEGLGVIAKTVSKTLTPMNVGVATFQKFAESSLLLSTSLDSATSAFSRTTGTGDKYSQTIVEVERRNRSLGVSATEASAAVGALHTGFTEFLMMGPEHQANLADTVSEFEKMGIEAGTTTKFLQGATRNTGMMTREAQRLQKSLMGTAKAFGDDLNQVMSDAADIMPQLAMHGDKLEAVLDDLYVASKRTGMGMSEIISISEKFDTFESAADAAGNLNSVLASMGGTTLIDTMEILETTNPAERMQLFADAIQQSVGNYDDLDYYQKKAIASATGLTDEQVLLMMNQEQQTNALDAAMTRAGLSQEEIVELQTQGRDLMTEMKVLAMSFGVALLPAVEYVKGMIGSLNGFLDRFTQMGVMGDISKLGVAIGVIASFGLLLHVLRAAFFRGTSPAVVEYTHDALQTQQLIASDNMTRSLIAAGMPRADAARIAGQAADWAAPGTGPTPSAAGGRLAMLSKAVSLIGPAMVALGGIKHVINEYKKAGEEENEEKRLKKQVGAGLGGLAGAAGGAKLGMMLGTMVAPGVGTLIGGALGAAIMGGGIGAGLGAKAGSAAAGMMANGGITAGPSIAGEAGPEAVVPLPNGRMIPVQLNTAAFEPLIKKLDDVATRITAAVESGQKILVVSDLEAAGFIRGTRVAIGT
jgi:ABC-type transporter Mla subunit MlaD